MQPRARDIDERAGCGDQPLDASCAQRRPRNEPAGDPRAGGERRER
jgi:hypothetical protein